MGVLTGVSVAEGNVAANYIRVGVGLGERVRRRKESAVISRSG